MLLFSWSEPYNNWAKINHMLQSLITFDIRIIRKLSRFSEHIMRFVYPCVKKTHVIIDRLHDCDAHVLLSNPVQMNRCVVRAQYSFSVFLCSDLFIVRERAVCTPIIAEWIAIKSIAMNILFRFFLSITCYIRILELYLGIECQKSGIVQTLQLEPFSEGQYNIKEKIVMELTRKRMMSLKVDWTCKLQH